MLSSYAPDLPDETSNMIKQEVRDILGTKLGSLLEALFDEDKSSWFSNLLIEQPNRE
jgi:hypothetical protein